MKEKIPKHNIFLRYKTDLYFLDYMLAIQIDENGHKNRNIDYQTTRQIALEQKLGCNFIGINTVKKPLILRYLDRLNKWLKNSEKKISMRLLGLEFKSDNIIKSRAITYIVQYYCPIISNTVWCDAYGISCNTANQNLSIKRTKQNRLMLLSN